MEDLGGLSYWPEDLVFMSDLNACLGESAFLKDHFLVVSYL